MAQRQKIRLSFLPQAREVDSTAGTGIIAVASEAGVPLSLPCGRGLCGGCRVRYVAGAPEPGEWDRLHIPPESLADGVRLGCLSAPITDAILSVPRQGAPLSIEGRTYPYRLSPPAQRAVVCATAEQAEGEVGAILSRAALGEKPREMTLHVSGGELQRVELGTNRSDHLGVAARVRDDRLSGWLLDLRTGRELASAETALIGEAESGAWAAGSVDAAAKRLVRSLCTGAHRRTQDVSDVVVAGGSSASGLPVGGAAPSRIAPLRLSGAGDDAIVDAACTAAVAVGCEAGESTLLLGTAPYVWALLVHGDRIWLAATRGWRRDPTLFAQGAAVRTGEGRGGRKPTGSPGIGDAGDETAPAPLPTVADALAEVARLRRLGVLDHRGARVDRGDGTVQSAAPRGDDGEEASSDPSHAGSVRILPSVSSDAPSPEPLVTGAHVRGVQRLRAEVLSCLEALFRESGVSADRIDRAVLVDDAADWSPADLTGLGLLREIPVSRVQAFAGAVGVGVRLALLSSEAGEEVRRLAAACARLPDREPGRGWAEGLYLPAPEERASPTARTLTRSTR